MKTFFAPFLPLVLMIVPFRIFAEPPHPSAPDPVVADLCAELDSLKTRTATWEKILAALP